MVSRPKIIELKNVYRTYLQGSEKVPALKNISLSIDSGEFCMLMGPSGCGKSTLINLIGGLDLPDSGTIFFDGKPTGKFTDQDWTYFRRTKIGIIFQFFNLLPTLTVHENISLPLILNKINRKEIERKVGKILEQVGLEQKSQAFPRELSGGEQQRVAIARAVIHSPLLLLADEPTGNLDSKKGKEILELVRNLSTEREMTLIMATHSRDAASFGSRILSMKDGEIQPA